MVDTNELIAQLILEELNWEKQSKAIFQAKIALLDMFYALFIGLDQKESSLLKELYDLSDTLSLVISSPTSAINSALINGFAAHFEDVDDVQANLRGHPSAVIFPSLLAIREKGDTLDNLLKSYLIGLEFAAHIGSQVNPEHAKRGFHSTATIGSLGAAAAIAHFKKFSKDELITLLSFTLSQFAGALSQEGSQGKPMNVGLASQKAVQSYFWTKKGLTSDKRPFDSGHYLNRAYQFVLDFEHISNSWFNPSQVLSPGLWFKKDAYCSAGIAIHNAAQVAYQEGAELANIKSISLHFAKNGDLALTHRSPQNGLEGKFSAEYLVWLGLHKGYVSHHDFLVSSLPESFYHFKKKLTRVNDLEQKDFTKRPAKLNIEFDNGLHKEVYIEDPKGSPLNPLSFQELSDKWFPKFGDKASYLLEVMSDTTLELDSFLNRLKEVISNGVLER